MTSAVGAAACCSAQTQHADEQPKVWSSHPSRPVPTLRRQPTPSPRPQHRPVRFPSAAQPSPERRTTAARCFRVRLSTHGYPAAWESPPDLRGAKALRALGLRLHDLQRRAPASARCHAGPVPRRPSATPARCHAGPVPCRPGAMPRPRRAPPLTCSAERHAPAPARSRTLSRPLRLRCGIACADARVAWRGVAGRGGAGRGGAGRGGAGRGAPAS